MKEILVVGFGSEILMDDGIGIHLVYDLEAEYNNSNIRFQTFLTYSLDIVEYLKDFKSVIILDGIKTGEVEPGMVYNWDCENAKPTIHLSNFHDIHLLDALNLCQKLGWNMPGTIKVIAIETEDNITFSSKLSLVLTEQYEDIKLKVKQIINQHIENFSRNLISLEQ